jgi:molybdopterin synthase catalytic subunit
VNPPETDETWVGLSPDPLPLDVAAAWVVRPACGAVVTFSGTARDHGPGRDGVVRLEYEAYESQAVSKLTAVASELRRRWPDVGRVAMLHRVGVVPIGESAVVVAVSAPHRDAAFEAARFGIDAIKASVPIWKRETWRDGESWGLDVQDLVDPSSVDDRTAAR